MLLTWSRIVNESRRFQATSCTIFLRLASLHCLLFYIQDALAAIPPQLASRAERSVLIEGSVAMIPAFVKLLSKELKFPVYPQTICRIN